LVVVAGMVASAPAWAADGHRVYVDEGCQVCHGGMGGGGVGPQFVDNPFLAFGDYVVGRILVGGGEMPAFAGKMPDADIAAVANYVRDNWGRGGSHISTGQVTNERKSMVPGPSVTTTPEDVSMPAPSAK
jgi:mono/diheme cytochrome c family protein